MVWDRLYLETYGAYSFILKLNCMNCTDHIYLINISRCNLHDFTWWKLADMLVSWVPCLCHDTIILPFNWTTGCMCRTWAGCIPAYRIKISVFTTVDVKNSNHLLSYLRCRINAIFHCPLVISCKVQINSNWGLLRFTVLVEYVIEKRTVVYPTTPEPEGHCRHRRQCVCLSACLYV